MKRLERKDDFCAVQTQSVKYKAKGWINIFGARGSKALVRLVTNYYSYSATALVSNGSEDVIDEKNVIVPNEK